MKEYVVDLTAASTWPHFIAAFNEGFIRPVGGEWHGHLDAFNDHLSWPGDERDEAECEPFRLILRGWNSSSAAINEHKDWDGRPILDVISEILRDNSHVVVIRD